MLFQGAHKKIQKRKSNGIKTVYREEKSTGNHTGCSESLLGIVMRNDGPIVADEEAVYAVVNDKKSW